MDKLFIFAFSRQYATIYIHRWIYVMWTYGHREFLTIFGQCINVLNYNLDCLSRLLNLKKINLLKNYCLVLKQ